MLRFADALEGKILSELAVRRPDFDDLRANVNALTEAPNRTEQRVDRLGMAITLLAEAQSRTEKLVGELVEAQKRTEQQMETLAAAQIATNATLRQIGIHVDKLRSDQLEGHFARLLRQSGHPAVPTIAGEEATMGAQDAARIDKVALVQNGAIQFWEEALEQAFAN
jgi:chromosome segregation ATPase